MSTSTPPAQICITRHGETDWNISGILQGWIDVPLNETGRHQSSALARELAGFAFASICSSPLQRSTQTAEILAQAWGQAPPRIYAGLKERHFGHIQGMTKQALSIAHPGLHQEITRRNPAAPFADGESLDHFADRVMDAIQSIARDHAGQRVLVITHGWVMDVITREVRGVPRHQVLEMKRRNGESLWVEVDDSGLILEIAPPAH